MYHTWVLIVIVSYLIGAIPFGYIVARRRGIDITKFGSGATGATNVLRTLGPGPAIVSGLLDVLKGAASIALARHVLGAEHATAAVLAGFSAMAGHSYSPYLRFKGGKGVATGAGVLVSLMPRVTLYAILVFIIIVAITKYVSLGSITAALVAAGYAWYLRQPEPYLLFITLGAILVVFQHRGNIRRLVTGKELKLGERVKIR